MAEYGSKLNQDKSSLERWLFCFFSIDGVTPRPSFGLKMFSSPVLDVNGSSYVYICL